MSTEEETAYQKIWAEARQKLNVTAKEFIPRLYDALVKDGYPPKEARDKIKKDAFNIWKVDTIDKYIPKEAKQVIRVLAGQKGGISKSEEDKKRSLLESQSSKNNGDGESKDEENPESESPPPPPTKRTPESPDHSMVQQLNHINIQLKKELEDLQELMDMRMADKDKRIRALVNDVLDRDKAIQLLTEENTQLKAELGRHRRLEELRLEAQRKAIKEWRNPGDKP